MIERIKLFMDSYNLTAADLADEIDVQRSGISHLLSGRNNPSLAFITKLLEHYPELSPDWLLFDTGSMIRGSINETVKEKKTHKTPDLFQEFEKDDAIEKDPIDTQSVEDKIDNKDSLIEEPPIVRSEDEIPYGMSKNVEKIVIFYRDRTFIEYSSR